MKMMKKYLILAASVGLVIVLFTVVARSQQKDNKPAVGEKLKTPQKTQDRKFVDSTDVINKGRAMTDISMLNSVVEHWRVKNGSYPTGNYAAAAGTLVTDGFIKETPVAPKGYTYSYTAATGRFAYAVGKVSKSQPVKTGVMTSQKIQNRLTIAVKGEYLLFLPETYGQPNKRFPLILFLHGSGESGTDLNKVKKIGIPRVAPLRKNFPFIVLAPQCPKGVWWTDTGMIIRVMAMLDEVCNKYNVDRDRIYLTGLSMGGFGTWTLLEQFPNRFAAAAVVCGSGGNRYLAGRMRNVPIRIYHGGKDKRVSIMNSQMMNSVLKKVGANVKLIVYPKMGHSIWSRVYTSDDFYDWLLKQKKGTVRTTVKKTKSPVRTNPR